MLESILCQLKDFQLRTVDYVYRRLYSDQDSTRRFLIADEVGLGKTLVARGIIERAYAHMKDKSDHFNVVYICSNAAIAGQNLNRLNITGDGNQTFATRLTFLPMQIRQMSQNKVNFVSFTPGTTFDLKSRGGTMRERAIIYQLLRGSKWQRGRGLLNLLQGQVYTKNWHSCVQGWTAKLDEGLKAEFLNALEADDSLQERLLNGCYLYRRRRSKQRPRSHRNQALGVIGDLRQLLAKVCVNSLEPDLLILDEFQRFKDLLDGNDDTALLARSLFNYPGARTLLLSATPYRMLTLDAEEAEDHYQDFVRTLRFLAGDREPIEIRKLIRSYRTELFSLGKQSDQEERFRRVRDQLQQRLLRVMCRTERVGITRRLDAMVSNVPTPCPLEPRDLSQAAASDAVARSVGTSELTEYWKSSPYLLSFTRDYQIGRKIDKESVAPSDQLLTSLAKAGDSMVSQSDVWEYEAVDAGNARMRSLFQNTLDKNLWRLLWMPPSLPYSQPSGAYSGINGVTKTLVFSSWSMVPDAIASICSYGAERRMLTGTNREFAYRDLYDTLRPLLRFTADSKDEQRLTGMPTLAWMLPSPTLASSIDPLEIALKDGQGKPVPRDTLVEQTRRTCAQLLSSLPLGVTDGREDERWYWAAPAMLEESDSFRAWLADRDGWVKSIGGRELGSRFADHVAQLSAVAEEGLNRAGKRPHDLDEVIALLALASPGTCALRSLMRIAPGLDPMDPELLSASVSIASGFRTLFNLPETIGMLRAGVEDEHYWRRTLNYCLDGNLQAMLDEQCHVLVDSLGLAGHDEKMRVKGVAESIASSLSIRTARVQAREYLVRDDAMEVSSFNIRSRFALRFGELRDDKGSTLARAGVVRDAFNSPFRPFVLATTSIGQEGLDFHTWCHAVTHWNLPANPVDLEQREGRVHRYKGHAIRKNLAERYGLRGLNSWNTATGDPWQYLFDRAKKDRPTGSTDLIPYWVYEEGSARVERRVPMLPMSREEDRLEGLLRALALYRLVFGQPRQEDLLSHLLDQPGEGECSALSAEFRINLQP